jgi:hypothetical protein
MERWSLGWEGEGGRGKGGGGEERVQGQCLDVLISCIIMEPPDCFLWQFCTHVLQRVCNKRTGMSHRRKIIKKASQGRLNIFKDPSAKPMDQ